jgi:hypothetical protein
MCCLICVSAPPHPTTLSLDVSRISKHASFASLVLIPRTFETIGTLERLEPTLVFNVLNGAVERFRRLTSWFRTVACCLVPHACLLCQM